MNFGEDVSVRKDKSVQNFIYLVIINIIIFQIISIFRDANIYNTGILANYANILISLFILLVSLLNVKRLRFNINGSILFIIPVVYFFYGVLINGFGRDLLADTYNPIFFIISIIYIRNSNFKFDNHILIKIADLMLGSLIISIVLNTIAPAVGIKITTIGITSVYFAFPFIVYLTYKLKVKSIITLALLIIGSKRGVLLGLIVVFFVIGFSNRKLSLFKRLIILLTTLVLFIGTLYLTLDPNNISILPLRIQPLFYKIMFINPFSEYNRLQSDYRILEVRNALMPLVSNKMYLITGMGAGYTYNIYDTSNVLLMEASHNTHFSPVSIYVKYGMIYLFAIYNLYIKTLYKNYKLYKKRILSKENEVLLLYSIAAFVNSFTAFTLFIDYLFIISIAILSRRPQSNWKRN